MEELKDKKCVPCEGGTPPLQEAEIKNLIPKIKDWVVIENKKITKEFTFQSFKQALAFLNRVGELAEQEGHHPDLNLHDYKKLTITLSTHAIGGLSENDFILASKIDALLD